MEILKIRLNQTATCVMSSNAYVHRLLFRDTRSILKDEEAEYVATNYKHLQFIMCMKLMERYKRRTSG
jgi:hypothetical protein